MRKVHFKNIDWTNALFLSLSPIASIILVILFFKNNDHYAPQIILGVVFYFLTGMSITAGYHRLFSHRTYKAHFLLRLFYLLFGAAAFQNSALKWSHDHRIHHNHVDEELDPYNINRGFFWAHMGWIFFKEEDSQKKYPKDLLQDSLVVWQHKYYFPIAIFMGLILPTLIGGLFGSFLGGFALSGLFRVVFVHHCTFFINSLCHVLGSRPYTDENTARDSFILAFFTYGEGYHNYHHYFPTDYRNGIRWYQYDPTKWLIKFTELTGFAFDLKKYPERVIKEAQEKMGLKQHIRSI